MTATGDLPWERLTGRDDDGDPPGLYEKPHLSGKGEPAMMATVTPGLYDAGYPALMATGTPWAPRG